MSFQPLLYILSITPERGNNMHKHAPNLKRHVKQILKVHVRKCVTITNVYSVCQSEKYLLQQALAQFERNLRGTCQNRYYR